MVSVSELASIDNSGAIAHTAESGERIQRGRPIPLLSAVTAGAHLHLWRCIRILLLFAFVGVNVQAALPAGTVWEVRTAGNANNGGCYITGSTGVDYSQQDAAQYTFTDLVLVTTTTMSSASHAFDANDIGNCIHITAGTNFTQGFYRIISQAAGVATVDRAAGTMGATGGTFAVGGAVALPTTICTSVVKGNTIYLKAGTYTATTSCALTDGSNTTTSPSFIGYTSTRGDNGKATWTTATNTTPLITYTGLPYAGLNLYNFTFTNTAGTRAEAVVNSGSQSLYGLNVMNATFDGFSTAILIRNGVGNYFTNVEIKNSTVGGLLCGNSNSLTSCVLFNTWIHNNTGVGVNFQGSFGELVITQSVIANNTGDGVRWAPASSETANTSGFIFSSVVYTNGGNGINASSASIEQGLVVANTIIYGNTSTGVTAGTPLAYQFAASNAYGANGANRSNFNAGTGDVALSADPFTNAAAGNYALNATAGGGAALKAVGFPGVSLFGTGFLDIGALQSPASASGTAPSVVGVVN